MRILLKLFVVGLLLVSGTPLLAQNTGLSGTNLEFYHPAIDPFGYFGVNGPQLMKAGQFYLHLSQSFSDGPSFQVAVNGAPVNIVDRVFTTGLTGALAISDFLTMALEFPFHPYVREANFNSLAPFTTESLGDLRLAFKIRILGETERRPGLSLLIINSIPTGDENKFLGTSHMVPGADLILGKDFGGKDLKIFSLAANVGARFPEQKTILGVNFDDQILYGVGAAVPFGFFDPHLSLVGEIHGHFEPNRIQTLTAPLEFTAGLRKDFLNGVTVSAGAGGAWNNAIGNPRVRGIVSVGYSPAWVQDKGNIKKDWKLKLKEQLRTTVYYRERAIHPTEESRGWLRSTAQTLKAHPELRTILIEGHTDSKESPTGSEKLSLRRAEEVKKNLVREGIESDRLKTEGHDGYKPVAPNEMRTGRTLNRRVEVSVF